MEGRYHDLRYFYYYCYPQTTQELSGYLRITSKLKHISVANKEK